MSGRITAKADGAQCSIASPRLLLTARDKPLSQLFTLRRVFLELERLRNLDTSPFENRGNWLTRPRTGRYH